MFGRRWLILENTPAYSFIELIMTAKKFIVPGLLLSFVQMGIKGRTKNKFFVSSMMARIHQLFILCFLVKVLFLFNWCSSVVGLSVYPMDPFLAQSNIWKRGQEFSLKLKKIYSSVTCKYFTKLKWIASFTYTPAKGLYFKTFQI